MHRRAMSLFNLRYCCRITAVPGVYSMKTLTTTYMLCSLRYDLCGQQRGYHRGGILLHAWPASSLYLCNNTSEHRDPPAAKVTSQFSSIHCLGRVRALSFALWGLILVRSCYDLLKHVYTPQHGGPAWPCILDERRVSSRLAVK